MRLTSTRDKSVDSSFANAILNCMPKDGGLYVPSGTENLRRWILYTNENTSFTSIAGAMTSAFIKNEFSPLISEAVATRAFPFSPVFKQLDEKLFTIELFHGPTLCHRDFGVSYVVSLLETIFQIENNNAIFLDFTTGEHGAILAKSLKGKKHLKSVLIYPKGKVCGVKEEDFIWNGGNIYPIEFDGTQEQAKALINSTLKNEELVKKYHLTTSTTVNIGRLMPQCFYFIFAFSRLKNKICDDIFYALDPENFGNLVAGLYSWRMSLPVTGFIVPTTPQLAVDVVGNPSIIESVIPVTQRSTADASDPSNLERLEDFFSHYAPMMKSFVHATNVTEAETEHATKEMFVKYNRFVDYNTAKAYAAALKNQSLVEEESSAIILLDRFHPGYSHDYIKQTVGESIEVPQEILDLRKTISINRAPITTAEELEKILQSI